MSTITIELSQFIDLAGEISWKADVKELTGSPPVGTGRSKEKAVAVLFLKLGGYVSFSEQDVLQNVTDINFVEVPLQEPTNQPATPEFVVPEYVVQCINSLNLEDLADYAAIGISRVLTMTAGVSHRGIFTDFPKNVEFQLLDGTEVCVDFSNLPLFPYQFKYNLIKRCQRVGQAILDAQNKPKPIDPDEGLPTWEEVETVASLLHLDNNSIRGRYNELFSCNASAALTGASSPSWAGVFEVNHGQYYFVADGKSFTVEFLKPLVGGNLVTEIPARIRLVREARAKALQEAGFSG